MKIVRFPAIINKKCQTSYKSDKGGKRMVHKRIIRMKREVARQRKANRKEDAYFKRICTKASTKDKIVKRPRKQAGFRGEDSRGLYYNQHYLRSGSYGGSGSYRFGSLLRGSYRGSGSFGSGSANGAFGLELGGYGLHLI